MGMLDLEELPTDTTFIRAKKGDEIGKTKVGKDMKLEIFIDASGLPLGMTTAGANVSEQPLLMPALDNIPLALPKKTSVIAYKGHDSYELCDQIEQAGFEPLMPHRRNRVQPSSNDRRHLRRYKHRWRMARTNAWLHRYRSLAVLWPNYSFMYFGLVYLSFIQMALQRF